MNNHFVYWYHLKEHTNPYTQGYIGVTKNLAKRHYEHFRPNNVQYHFYRAIQKYDKENIIRTILHENVSRDEAYDLERQYRPTNNIGWNYNSGGKVLYKITFHKVTLFHKDNPEKEYTFDSITEASEALDLNRLRISSALQRKTNSYSRDGWHIVNENTDKNTILDNSAQMSKIIKGRKHTIKFHPRWVTVELWHISDPTKIYTFKNLPEACSILNLKKSALEHKLQRKCTTPTKLGWCIKRVGSQDSPNE